MFFIAMAANAVGSGLLTSNLLESLGHTLVGMAVLVMLQHIADQCRTRQG